MQDCLKDGRCLAWSAAQFESDAEVSGTGVSGVAKWRRTRIAIHELADPNWHNDNDEKAD